jgi:hypothetical protein
MATADFIEDSIKKQLEQRFFLLISVKYKLHLPKTRFSTRFWN